MADRRQTYVDPKTRCGHAVQLAEALGLPPEDWPRRLSQQYWDDMLDKVRRLATATPQAVEPSPAGPREWALLGHPVGSRVTVTRRDSAGDIRTAVGVLGVEEGPDKITLRGRLSYGQEYRYVLKIEDILTMAEVPDTQDGEA